MRSFQGAQAVRHLHRPLLPPPLQSRFRERHREVTADVERRPIPRNRRSAVPVLDGFLELWYRTQAPHQAGVVAAVALVHFADALGLAVAALCQTTLA